MFARGRFSLFYVNQYGRIGRGKFFAEKEIAAKLNDAPDRFALGTI